MHDTAYSSTKDINAVPTPLIKTLVKNSASGVDWMESHGIKLPVLSQCGGHSAARTHRPTTGAAGGYITLGLLRHVKKYAKKNQCKIIKKAQMTELIKENGRVVGLKYIDSASGQTKSVRGMGVVIATGGFCYNKEMIAEYSPTNVDLSTTNGHWANGEGMLVAKKAGAKLVDMACVQELRVGFVEPVLHYVMGGIAINTDSQCLDDNDRVIPGLFACGETAGGVHGRNRLAGNSLVECVVYGRVSGDSAVKYMSGTRSKL